MSLKPRAMLPSIVKGSPGHRSQRQRGARILAHLYMDRAVAMFYRRDVLPNCPLLRVRLAPIRKSPSPGTERLSRTIQSIHTFPSDLTPPKNSFDLQALPHWKTKLILTPEKPLASPHDMR